MRKKLKCKGNCFACKFYKLCEEEVKENGMV